MIVGSLVKTSKLSEKLVAKILITKLLTLKDPIHCAAKLGGNSTVPPQLKILNIFNVNPLITLQMFVGMLQDYTGPMKKD